MSEISAKTQFELSEEILHQLRVLSELLQENPAAYKICYEVSEHFTKYAEHARMLSANNAQLELLGGY